MFQWTSRRMRTTRSWWPNCRGVLTAASCCQSGDGRGRAPSRCLGRPRDSCRGRRHHPRSVQRSRPACRSTSGRTGRTGATVRGGVEVESPFEHDAASYEEPAGNCHSHNFHVAYYRPTFFSERVVNVWNSLPASVDFSSFCSFKRTVKFIDLSAF